MFLKINFYQFSRLTFFLIFLVIIAGSIVRMSGAGMGCPDWPKCFGMWVPPIDASDLPANYQEIYKDRGYAETEFNPLHTWTEYINRLIGAIAGFFTFLLFLFSIKERKKLLIFFTLLVLIAMLFQAWLGGIVVSSLLEPFKITLHMIMAIIILCLMLFVMNYGSFQKKQIVKSLIFKRILLLFMFLTFIQILLGTGVRENMDIIAREFNFEYRNLWIEELGMKFKIHRSFSIIVCFSALCYFVISIKENLFIFHLKIILGFLFLEVLIGIIMTYYDIPFYLQPLHLICAISIFVLQTDVLIKYTNSSKI